MSRPAFSVAKHQLAQLYASPDFELIGPVCTVAQLLRIGIPLTLCIVAPPCAGRANIPAHKLLRSWQCCVEVSRTLASRQLGRCEKHVCFPTYKCQQRQTHQQQLKQQQQQQPKGSLTQSSSTYCIPCTCSSTQQQADTGIQVQLRPCCRSREHCAAPTAAGRG